MQKYFYVILVLAHLMVSCNPTYETVTKMQKEEATAGVPTETDDLQFMWEEEKLARDVYFYIRDKYGSQVFSNISEAEQRHMDAIQRILDRKGIPTPVDRDAIGTFKNPDLKKLYGELIQRADRSLHDANQVGLDIEILDIKDLDERIKRATDPQVKKVFIRLKEGSLRHKRAFERQL